MVRDRGIWHGESVTEVLEALDTTTEGLSESESRSRLDRLGPNRLVELPSRPAFLRFLDQYNDPLNYLLMAAAVIAVLVSVLQDGEHNEGSGMRSSSSSSSRPMRPSDTGKRTVLNKRWMRPRRCPQQ